MRRRISEILANDGRQKMEMTPAPVEFLALAIEGRLGLCVR